MLLNFLRGLVHRPQRVTPLASPGISIPLERGLQHQIAGEWKTAEETYRHILRDEPRSIDALHLLGSLLHQQKRSVEAVPLLEQAALLAPRQAAIHMHLGGAYLESGETERAITSLERATNIDPFSSAACSNLGIVYKQTGLLDRAEAVLRRATFLDSRSVEAWHNLGSVLRELGEERQAIECFDKALEIDPKFLEARYSRALALLACGELNEGWCEYEVRLQLPRRASDVRPFSQAVWRGAPLNDRSILIWGEQGVGDEIFHAGAYGEIVTQARRCVIECHAKLVALFTRSFREAQVIPRTLPVSPVAGDAYDYQVPAGSVLRYMRPNLAAFPKRARYLIADKVRTEHWRRRLAQLGSGTKLGFCWRSSNLKGARALACSNLTDWGPVLGLPGIQAVCLQYDDCAAELTEARQSFGRVLHRFEEVDYFDDIDEVAALTSALDLVISAPTAVSVLAAALGVPTWQLTYGADWQVLGTDRNPWYPTMTRFPRRWDQQWPHLISDVAEALRTYQGSAR